MQHFVAALVDSPDPRADMVLPLSREQTVCLCLLDKVVEAMDVEDLLG
jgi:hypothetical protein